VKAAVASDRHADAHSETETAGCSIGNSRADSASVGSFRTDSGSVGISASSSHAESAPMGSSSTNSGSLGFSVVSSHAAGVSVPGSCMDMSVDEHRNSVSVVQKSNVDAKTVESKSLPSSRITKHVSADEMMEGSFRDELKNCHANSVPSIAKSLPISLAQADNLISVDKSTVKSLSSFGTAGQNHAKSDGLVKSSGHVVDKPNYNSAAPVSFSDVAKMAAVPENVKERITSEINDSFAYRDQSAILISDDDDDDNADGRRDKTGSRQPAGAGTEAADNTQKLNLVAKKKDTSSEVLPESKPQSSECEVSVGKVCQPSTIITIRPPDTSLVQPVNSSCSTADLEKAIARRDAVSKLLCQKKVRVIIVLSLLKLVTSRTCYIVKKVAVNKL